ncbi:STAS-like domain-containing protein [Treponema pectinovorum]|uniref:STAS-like domain-containing protein n=1 Tax=Treponema pectinovorum TaxID=164 RepID=UPI0011F3C847|nr:STAS-like domain-containing protein [Treponema pectinovorum]
MANLIKKSVYQIVGSEICVEADDGKKVYDVICEFIRQKQPFVLSFLNVTMLTSAFLNTAIGLLYKDFSEEDIKKYLSVDDIDPTDAVLLKRVVNTAKLFYSDPERILNSLKEVLGESK